MTAPKCFDSEKQWKAWEYAAKRSRVQSPRLSFCLDCTVAYKYKMMKEGRCEYPNTIFTTIVNEDEDIEDIGVRDGRN